MSESEKMVENKELLDNAWRYIYNLNNDETTTFLYGIKLITLEEFKNKTNYSKFIDWDTFWHSNEEDTL